VRASVPLSGTTRQGLRCGRKSSGLPVPVAGTGLDVAAVLLAGYGLVVGGLFGLLPLP